MRRSDASGFSQGWFPPDLRNPRGRVFEGRLTATPGTDVTTADVTAGTTLSYTESRGNLISLPWKPGKWEAFELPRTPAGVYEITRTFLASSPWAIASGSNYDVFGFLGPNGPDLELGPAWSSDSARSAAGALARRNGVRVLARDPSRVFLGTIRASGTNTIEDSAAKRFAWNMYNRVARSMNVVGPSANHTYTTATWRQFNADATLQLAYVCGLAQDRVLAETCVATNSSSGNVGGPAGIGVDATNANSAQLFGGASITSVAAFTGFAKYRGVPGLGYHYLAWLQYSDAIGTTTWYGTGVGSWTGIAINGEVLA